ncbi:carboxymuconolactone decarboxylase family protein [Phenylobacterium montanum]|uniref:Carboxymuconolactone decarboxylase family protein n=1 Tax=Phenylobacterium montanum TaxID=2823693 RepID=A0A975IT87_9CAUL|nr:carboxymuconolactone decarboxylase family protein [Caulobacter sp. S6]QUD86523.1 carboxymuconolactone decarboxylase family protein [Caulobacter sp. S6]
MRLTKPRIAPVAEGDWTDEQRELVAPMADRGAILNIFRTFLNKPAAMKGFLGWGSYILSKKNSLPAREREIVILRIGYLCKAGYEWTQHVPIGQRAGLTDAEIARIKAGADAPGWSAADAALIRATDDLHHQQFVTEPSWADLLKHFDQGQAMDLVFTAGQYTQVSMLLNSFGVQLDEGQTLDPDLKGF